MKTLLRSLRILLGAGAFLVLACLHAGMAHAASSEAAAALYNEANAAYREGNYPAATEKYEKILTDGIRDARVEYNLACTYAKQGDIGRARLHFERALRLSPGDQDTRRNLSILEARIPGEAQRLEAGPFEFVVSFYDGLGRGRVFLIGLICWIFFWGAWAAERWWPSEGAWFQGLRILRFLVVFALAATGAIFYSKQLEFDLPRAVVVEESATVRSGPAAEEKEVVVLAPGRRVQTGRQRGAWVEVSVPGEFEGWIEQSRVAPIQESPGS